MGVTIVSGNTLDLYGTKRLIGHLISPIHIDVPVVGLSPDQGLTAIRVPKELWLKWMEECKELLNPMAGGSPWLAFSYLVRAKTPFVGIIDFAEAFLASEKWETGCGASRNAAEVLRWADDDLPASIFIISRSSYEALHPGLRNPNAPISHVELGLPTEADRKKIMPRANVKKMGGLTTRQLLQTKDGKANWQQLQSEAIKRSTDGTLTAAWHDSDFGYIGGLEEVKRCLLDEVIPAFERRDRYSPMGIIFYGPAGTGKSVVAEALSGHMGEPLYEWAGSPMTSSYVGENERRMKMALDIIQSTGGILYLDEGDKVFSDVNGPQGDSGVQMRLQMMLHSYLADNKHRGKTLCIMSLNRLHALPPSLRRAGRFDIILPFFPPLDSDDRTRVIEALQRKHSIDMGDEVRQTIASRTACWTGADLEALLMKARRRDPQMNLKTVEACLTNAKPTFTPEQMEKMVRETANEVRDLDLIPPALREQLGIGK